MNKKLISLISPCFNEAENIEELYRRTSSVIDSLTRYDFEYVFIDNASTDGTVELLKSIALKDKRVKIIVNNRNFGHIRSPYWGILQTSGDATVYLASDLQDPPEMIEEFINLWESGYDLVMAVKPVSEQNSFMNFLRRKYYAILNKVSDVSLTMDTTGFGLYDQKVIAELRKINDPYPYLRGLIDELGFPMRTVPFVQPRRVRGITKNNFYTLYDIAMLGLVSHSKVPFRLAAFLGLFIGFTSILGAIFTLIFKLIWWDKFEAGEAPLVIVIFMMFGLNMIFIGVLGEYVAGIHSYVKNRPIVVEKERVNF